jgi:hypothetical protein
MYVVFVNRRWTTDDGRQVMAKARIAFGKVNYKEYQNVNTHL